MTGGFGKLSFIFGTLAVMIGISFVSFGGSPAISMKFAHQLSSLIPESFVQLKAAAATGKKFQLATESVEDYLGQEIIATHNELTFANIGTKYHHSPIIKTTLDEATIKTITGSTAETPDGGFSFCFVYPLQTKASSKAVSNSVDFFDQQGGFMYFATTLVNGKIDGRTRISTIGTASVYEMVGGPLTFEQLAIADMLQEIFETGANYEKEGGFQLVTDANFLAARELPSGTRVRFIGPNEIEETLAAGLSRIPKIDTLVKSESIGAGIMVYRLPDGTYQGWRIPVA